MPLIEGYHVDIRAMLQAFYLYLEGNTIKPLLSYRNRRFFPPGSFRGRIRHAFGWSYPAGPI